MFTCIFCRFDVVLDDTLIARPNGHCICLRCYLREVDAPPKVMTKDFRRELVEAANGG